MTKQRPKNLNLLTIRLPIPAIVSILHRVSGLVLFILIPIALWALSFSLSSQDNFQSMHDTLSSPLSKFIIWLMLTPFLYHFVAGIRHLLMDINIGIELKSGRLSAVLTFIFSLLLFILAGIYIW
ncbi:MAG: succinate dehydrogenase, cytochrome b556 subunit [Gammaproteobacteria bacterium]|nr:succinate dehydrogenase, cytochrome b556 subunit [Gammaproteobacteria bacterium]